MRKICLLPVWMIVAFTGFAQTEQGTSKKSFAFHSINQIGILEGEAGTSLQLQTVAGVQYRKWFAGLGTALDYYSFRTIPVFVDIRRDFTAKNKTPFVYADAGVSYPWVKNEQKAWYSSKYTPGLYYDMGVGYRFSFKNSGALTMSVGYSQKKMTEKRPAPLYIDIWPNPYPYDYNNRYDYTLRRLSIKAGWVF